MATVEVVAFALCYKDQAGGNLSWVLKFPPPHFT
jgi:hypothetical protein